MEARGEPIDQIPAARRLDGVMKKHHRRSPVSKVTTTSTPLPSAAAGSSGSGWIESSARGGQTVEHRHQETGRSSPATTQRPSPAVGPSPAEAPDPLRRGLQGGLPDHGDCSKNRDARIGSGGSWQERAVPTPPRTANSAGRRIPLSAWTLHPADVATPCRLSPSRIPERRSRAALGKTSQGLPRSHRLAPPAEPSSATNRGTRSGGTTAAAPRAPRKPYAPGRPTERARPFCPSAPPSWHPLSPTG